MNSSLNLCEKRKIDTKGSYYFRTVYDVVATDVALEAVGHGVYSWAGQNGHSVAYGSPLSDISSHVRCSGAKLRRWPHP